MKEYIEDQPIKGRCKKANDPLITCDPIQDVSFGKGHVAFTVEARPYERAP